MTSTELLTPVDAEVVDLLDEAAAKKLDTRIRLTAGTVRENFAKLQDYVHEAKAGEIHRALGFKSWTAYLSDALGAQPLMVDREQRRELVEYLSSEGMSTRAIASATGSSRETVRRQVAGDPNVSPENRESPTTGLDGKTYSPKPRPVAEPAADDRFISSDELDELNAPPSAPSKRRPLTDSYSETVLAITKHVERLARLTADDRFDIHRDLLMFRNLAELGQAQRELTKAVIALAKEDDA
ncbi:hypothetical protein ABZU78_12020 [Rhodococcus erythropolis]|uniref:hypothetical protein n=1 Tax=Rhodococcus erythropolis TaxID=1833 RepID=UPI0033A6C111